jgi:hypothetical protein
LGLSLYVPSPGLVLLVRAVIVQVVVVAKAGWGMMVHRRRNKVNKINKQKSQQMMIILLTLDQ